MDLRVGDTVFGKTQDERYVVVRLIASGGFGTVYEVRNAEGGALALKTILTALLTDTKLKALQNEAHLATEIVHPNVVRVFFFHDGEQYPNLPPYMLLEYAESTLEDILNKRRATDHYFDSSALRDIFIQLASGMKAVNDKLVHRDIKPNNILVAQGLLKISDFGLSKLVGAATRLQTFKGINHVMYCAPEAWRFDENSPSMDMYSMGITFYEIATLCHPFNIEFKGDVIDAWRSAHFSQLPKNPIDYNSLLDPYLAQVIMKMMAKRIEDRYLSWDILIDRLRIPESKVRQGKDVSRLVQRALSSHQITERARLEMEKKARTREEQSDLLRYCFAEVFEAAKGTVEAFNKASELLKLAIRSDDFGFSIYADKGAGGPRSLICSVQPTEEELRIGDNQLVRAWGDVMAPSGSGLLLFLVARGDADLYGQWYALAATFPQTRRSDPMQWALFGRFVERKAKVDAIQRFETMRRPFEPDMLDPLIEELI